MELRRVVVSEKDKGIGQATVRLLDAFCQNALCRTRIWLDVLECNQRARHVYEKLGYTRYGRSEIIGKEVLLYKKVLD